MTTPRRGRRGYTVSELAVVVSIAGAITAGAGALYLEARIAAARSDANVQLTREASLAVETIARDLRDARKASSDTAGAMIDVGGDAPVKYVIDRSGLVRDEGDDRAAIARFVRSLAIREANGGFQLELTLERELAEGRRVRIVRASFVGTRRK